MTRPTMLGLLAIWIATLLWSAIRGKSSRRIAVIGAALGVVALIAFVCFDPRRHAKGSGIGDYEQFALFQLTHNLGAQLRTEGVANFKELFCVDLVRAVFGTLLGPVWINALFSSIILAAGIALIRLRAIWGLWIVMTMAISILLVSHDRYILQILPLLVLAWWLLLRQINLRLPLHLANILFVLLFFLGIFPNASLNVATIYHQQQRPFLAHYKDGQLQPYLQMAHALPTYVAPGTPVFAPTKLGRILTFESDRDVWEPDDLPWVADGSVYVVVDASDDDFTHWLSTSPIALDPHPLLSITRPGNAPPLLLLHGKLTR
jgi:hypothetical protein